jgi:hypothetical protein
VHYRGAPELRSAVRSPIIRHLNCGQRILTYLVVSNLISNCGQEKLTYYIGNHELFGTELAMIIYCFCWQYFGVAAPCHELQLNFIIFHSKLWKQTFIYKTVLLTKLVRHAFNIIILIFWY